MKVISQLLVLLVAILHIGFLVLEIFLWDHPIGYKVFGSNHEFASATAVLAKNQGLYNGFLAAGLIAGLLNKDLRFKLFFLVCVIAAGIFGALTVKTTILFVQAAPALLALIFVLLAEKTTAD